MNKKDFTKAMVGVTIFMIIFLIITMVVCIPRINKTKEEETTSETTTMALVTPATVYEPKVVNKNVYITVDGGVTGDEFVNLRSNPSMSDKYKIGKLETDTKLVVNEYYTSNEFIGFPIDAVKGILDIDDEDGIVWMSGYYLHIGAFDYPELAENPEGLVVLEVSSDYKTITIEGGDPNVRATPSTTNVQNVYGQIKDGTVFHPSVIVANDTYTFYGVKLDEIKDFVEVVGFGNIENDPDGIIWVSSAYAKLGY